MSTPASSVSWYVQTAGAAVGEDYQWIALDPGDDPKDAARILHDDLAGRPVRDLISDRATSVAAGRLPDGRYLVLVGGLFPAAAPRDYAGRPIRATVLGVTAPDADHGPLLAAAADALTGALADTLPISWSGDAPELDAAGIPWAPPSSGHRTSAATPLDTRESVALPESDTDRRAVADALLAIDPGELTELAAGQALLIAVPGLDREELTDLQPWRAVTSEVRERTVLKEGRSRPWHTCRWLVAAVGLGVVTGLALVAWWLLSRFGRG